MGAKAGTAEVARRRFWHIVTLCEPGAGCMPIHSVEYWEEKAWLAEEAAKAMNTASSKSAMIEIAELYRSLLSRRGSWRKLSERANDFHP